MKPGRRGGARLLLAAGLLAALALPAAAATRYVATTGSDETGEGTAAKPWRTINYAIRSAATVAGDTILVGGGLYAESVTNNVKHQLTFKGGYKADWTRDLRNCPSTVKPPANTLPCWYITGVASNRVSGFVLTGGKFGVVPQGQAIGADAHRIDRVRTVLSQLVITNNASHGVQIGNVQATTYGYAENCLIASCLIANNGGKGIQGQADYRSFHWIMNCTVTGNKSYGFGTEYGTAYFFAVNSIFRGNKSTDFSCASTHNRGATVERSFLGSIGTSVSYNKTTGAYTNHSIPLEGVFFLDPGLASDGSPLADGRAVKAGVDLRHHRYVSDDALLYDLYDSAWNGEYDVGAIKSTGANQCGFAASKDVYVEMDGSDAAAGTKAAPVASVEEGLYKTAAGGTCHVGVGEWTPRANLFITNQVLRGSGRGRTIFRPATTYDPPVILAASSAAVCDLSVIGGGTGIRVETAVNVVTNTLVDGCAVQSCTNGVVIPNHFQFTLWNDAQNWNVVRASRTLFTHNVNGLANRAQNQFKFAVDNCDFGWNDYGIWDGEAYNSAVADGSSVCHSTFVSNRLWAVWLVQGYALRPFYANNVFKGERGLRFGGYWKAYFYNDLFDCVTNLYFQPPRAYDEDGYYTNTCLYGDAKIEVTGTEPGRLLVGSPASRAGCDLTGLACGVLTNDFDGAARDVTAADIGAFVSPETKKILNPVKTYYVTVSGAPTTYGTPSPGYGVQSVEEGLQTFSATNNLVLYEDGKLAIYNGDGARIVPTGYVYTPTLGQPLVGDDAVFEAAVASDATCCWKWTNECALVVDAGDSGSLVSVNGGAYAAAVTNWGVLGRSVTVSFQENTRAESFDGWYDEKGARVSSVTQFVCTVSAPAAYGASRLANHFVATTGSDETGDGTASNPWRTIHHAIESGDVKKRECLVVQGGLYEEAVTNNTIEQLVIRGGYDADWKRDLKGHPTTIRPTTTKLDCLTIISVHSNLVEGVVLTGGAWGILSGGQSYQPGKDARRIVFHRFDKCVITNNASGGICTLRPYNSCGYMVTSSYIADNGGYGIFYNLDNSAFFYLWNCTLRGNKSYQIYFSYGCAPLSVKNSIGVSKGDDYNTYFFHLENYSTFEHYCAWGHKKSFGQVTTTYQPCCLTGVCETDPCLATERMPYLTDDSPLIGTAEDLSSHDIVHITEDLYGEPWNGVYDYGCVKNVRTGAAPAEYDDTYVATDGSDANTGADAAHPVKSPSLAIWRTKPGGTCHLAAGVYDRSVFLTKRGVKVRGAGIGRTVLCGLKSSDPARTPIYLGAHDVRVSDLTVSNAYFGVIYERPYACSNAVVERCEVKCGEFGVMIRGNSDDLGGNRFIYHQLPEQRDALFPVASNVLSHCIISNNTSHGIFAYGNSRNRVIADNVLVANNGHSGFYANGRGESELYNCTFVGNAQCGIYGNGTPPKVYGSLVCGSPVGLRRWTSADTVVYDSVVSGNDTNFYTSDATKYPFAHLYNVSEEAMRWDVNPRRHPFRPAYRSPATNRLRVREGALVVPTDDLAGEPREDTKRGRTAGCYLPRDAGGMRLILR